MEQKHDDQIEQDDEVVGDNAFQINGVITMPKEVEWEEFFDDMLAWLESKGASFFGHTSIVDDKGDAAREVLRDIISAGKVKQGD